MIVFEHIKSTFHKGRGMIYVPLPFFFHGQLGRATGISNQRSYSIRAHASSKI